MSPENKTGKEACHCFIFVDDLLRPGETPEEVIEGLLPPNSVVGLVAPSQSGKSLLALHLASCVSTGRPFFGRNCKRGLVVYLCGEGKAGLRARLQAIELHHKHGLHGAPLVVLPVAVSLLDSREVSRIKRAIAEIEAETDLKITLLVVDTLARFLAPGDESKAQDMSRFLNAVDSIRGGATALICHHTGHDHSRARGSSSWTASLDVEYRIERKGDLVTVSCLKMKDGETSEPQPLRIRRTDTLLRRKNGDPVSSAVLVPCDDTDTVSLPSGKNQLRLFSELQRRVESEGPLFWTEVDLRSIARGLGMHKNSARDAVRGLLNLGYLREQDGALVLVTGALQPRDRNGTEKCHRDEI
jgi:hypothetical protein